MASGSPNSTNRGVDGMDGDSSTLQLQNGNYEGGRKKPPVPVESGTVAVWVDVGPIRDHLAHHTDHSIGLHPDRGHHRRLLAADRYLAVCRVWADRYPRKFLIVSADALTAVSTLILAVLFLLGYGSSGCSSGIRHSVHRRGHSDTGGQRALAPNCTHGQVDQGQRHQRHAPAVYHDRRADHEWSLAVRRTPEAIFFIDVVTAILAVAYCWL